MLKKLLGYSSVSWISAIIGLIAMPVISRSFSAEDIGQINLLISTSSILYIIGLFGFDQAYIRFFYDCHDTQTSWRLLLVCLMSSLSITLVLLSLCVVFRDDISPIIATSISPFFVVGAIAVVVVTQIALRYTVSLFRLNDSLPLFALFSFLNTAYIKFGFIVGEGVSGAFKSLILEGCLLTVVSALILFVKGRDASVTHREDNYLPYRPLVAYGAPLMPAMLLSTVNGYIPVTLLRLSMGFDSAGVYSMVVTLASAVNLLSSGINTFWPPFVFENYKSKQGVIQSFHRLVVLAAYSLGVLLIGARSLIPLILGEAYSAATFLFPLLIISPIFYVIGETTGIGLQIEKRSGIYFFINASGVIVNVLLAVVLIPMFGLIGAGVSTAFAATTVLLTKSFLGNKFYNSTGSFRWLISAIALLWLLSLFVLLFEEVSVSSLFFVVFLIIFPLVVGFRDFCTEFKRLLSWLPLRKS